MSYPKELLETARDLMTLRPDASHQASLRRAVSTAYYALFHLLIEDAVSGCADEHFRASLMRVFDHGRMRDASEKTAAASRTGAGLVNEHLYTVANTFVHAYHNRHDADYNLEVEWHQHQVAIRLGAVEYAFDCWKLIRTAPEARAYLAAMLPGRDRRLSDRQRLTR